MSLTADMRKRVAEECRGMVAEVEHIKWQSGNEVDYIWLGGRQSPNAVLWQPEKNVYHKDALVTAIAELLDSNSDTHTQSVILNERFVKALTTGSVSDLEKLCFELITGEDES